MRRPQLHSLRQLWRYYQVGIVNSAFGYGLYALFVAAGINMYAAQLLAHILGVVFNYFTYSRHVFPDARPSKIRFILSYAANYVMGLAALAAASQLINSPYLAGLAAVVVVSMANYLILRHMVFAHKRQATS